jgi:hypothetical protein
MRLADTFEVEPKGRGAGEKGSKGTNSINPSFDVWMRMELATGRRKGERRGRHQLDDRARAEGREIEPSLSGCTT